MKKFLLAITALVLFAGSAICQTANNTWSVGTGATGIELYDGVLRPVTTGGVSLGDSSLRFSNLYLSGSFTATGNVTTSGFLVRTPQILSVTGAVAKSPLIFTSSYVQLTSTAAYTLTGFPKLSTTSVATGTYVMLTSTSTANVIMPVSAADYVIGVSSPAHITTNDHIGLIFNGTYWVIISSTIQ